MKKQLLSLFGLLLCFTTVQAQDNISNIDYQIIHGYPKVTKIFSSGGSALILADNFDKHGSVGQDCGQYVIPRHAMEYLLDGARSHTKSGGTCYDAHAIAESLGITDGSWDHKELVRVDLRGDALEELNLRWPKKKDCVLSPDWYDRDNICCGIPVAIVDRVPKDYYIVIDNDMKPCPPAPPRRDWWCETDKK